MKDALPKRLIDKILWPVSAAVLLLSQGCCTPPPAISDGDYRPRTEVDDLEVKIGDLMTGPCIIRRSQNQLLNPAHGPVPEAVFDRAKQAREAVLSDEDYRKALSSFEEVITRRLRALEAERHVYEAWRTGDRFGPPDQKDPGH